MAKAQVKQPFELPEFYVPWPARLNPSLESARRHSKAWAREMEQEDAAKLLEQTLEEEKKADELLNSLAEEINSAANAEESEDDEEDEED